MIGRWIIQVMPSALLTLYVVMWIMGYWRWADLTMAALLGVGLAAYASGSRDSSLSR